MRKANRRLDLLFESWNLIFVIILDYLFLLNRDKRFSCLFTNSSAFKIYAQIMFLCSKQSR